MKLALFTAAIGMVFVSTWTADAPAQSVTRAYTKFDSKRCIHKAGTEEEDYGSWRCKGHDGIAVYLSAGDQRMQVSFGRKAADEPAASQTFPAFNDVYEGTIEWRLEQQAKGKPKAFATILRWNIMTAPDARTTTGRVLVVTRLGPGGVCQVGYVDARANPDANALAQQLADEEARKFQCGKDKPITRGKVSPGLNMPDGS
jgi:hypothetical protein